MDRMVCALLNRNNVCGTSTRCKRINVGSKSDTDARAPRRSRDGRCTFIHPATSTRRGNRFFKDSESAGSFLRTFLRAGDAVLFKGSRGVHVEAALAKMEE